MITSESIKHFWRPGLSRVFSSNKLQKKQTITLPITSEHIELHGRPLLHEFGHYKSSVLLAPRSVRGWKKRTAYVERYLRAAEERYVQAFLEKSCFVTVSTEGGENADASL
jgi:hypothetical protein